MTTRNASTATLMDEATLTGVLGDVAVRRAGDGRPRDLDVDFLALDASRRQLPPCLKCGAALGDPCRRPSGRTTPPHVNRVLDELRVPPVAPPEVAAEGTADAASVTTAQEVKTPVDRSPQRNAGRSTTGDARVPHYPRGELTEIAQHLRLTASRFLVHRVTAGDLDEAARMWIDATSRATTSKCDR